MTTRAKLGVVTTSYPRFEGDAAGSFVAAHVAYLRARGADVEVIAAGDAAARDRAGDGVIRVPAPPGIFYAGGAPDAIEAGASRVALARFALAMGAEVWRRARGWDATCAHWWVPCAAAAAAAGAPRLLAIAHGGDIYAARRAHVLAPVAAALLARRAKLVFVSRALRDATLAAVPGAIARRIDEAAIVQPMGIDVAAFRALRSSRAARGNPATIAVLARLVPIKGVAIAIEAMRHVRAPARLVIAGDGPLRAALTEHARGLPIQFRGELTAADRDALLRTADLVIVPSIELDDGRTEGTPMIALEAIAAGVPVVASATGGLADLPVRLVPPGDPCALAAAIDQTLTEPAAPPRDPSAHDWAAVGAALDAHWAR